MAHSNVFSEIEKSLNRTVSREEFFHGVWSNEKSSKLTDTTEFNNSFSSENDEKTSTADDIVFHNEVGNLPANEMLPTDSNHERDKDVPQTVEDSRPDILESGSISNFMLSVQNSKSSLTHWMAICTVYLYQQLHILITHFTAFCNLLQYLCCD